MVRFFLGVFEISAGVSLFVLALLLVLRLAGKKFTSRCRYVLWTLVLLRLAIPISFNILPAMIEIPVSDRTETNVQLQEEQPNDTASTPPVEEDRVPVGEGSTTVVLPGVTVTVPTEPTAPVYPTDPITPPADSTVDVQPPIPEQVIIPDNTDAETPTEPKEPVSVLRILEIAAVIYIAGAVIFFLCNMLSYIIYSRRILRSARNADAGTIAIFLSVCDKENLKKVPVLLVSPDINSPAAFGLFSRKIVLPDITFTQNGLAGTLFHEVVHCKRGDLYIKVIELIARSLHWFNPISHIAAFKCEMEMEMSCDEAVLAGCSDEARGAYGEVMLDIIRRCRRNRGALTTHFNPRKSSVKARFANIINGSGSRRGKVLIPICLVLCLLAGTIISCTTGDKKPPEETDAPEKTTTAIELSISFHDWEKIPTISGTELYDTTSGEEGLYADITSNIDVKDVKITKLFTTDLKISDCVPLYIVDVTANEPIYLKVSVPGTMGSYGITYTDTDGTVKRFEITTSGEDGAPILVEITEDRLTDDFKGSDLFEGEYELLIKDAVRDASLYYYYDGTSSDFASKFRISANGKEFDITTSMPARLRNTREPQLYRFDRTADGGEYLLAIFTTGTGTGVHTEEAYAINCTNGEVYAIPNPCDATEGVVSRNEDGKAWTVNDSGEKIELPDNAYFDKNFSFYARNGKLYAKVLIGYGILQYSEDYFLIEYGYDNEGCAIVTSIKHSSQLDGSEKDSSDNTDGNGKNHINIAGVSYSDNRKSFLPHGASRLHLNQTVGRTSLHIYSTDDNTACVYLAYQLDDGSYAFVQTTLEQPEYSVLGTVVHSIKYFDGTKALIGVQYTRDNSVSSDVTYSLALDEEKALAELTSQDTEEYLSPMWEIFDETTQFEADIIANYIPDIAAQTKFFHRINGTDYYLYFCAVRRLDSNGAGYTDHMPYDFSVYYIDVNTPDILGQIDAKLPAEIEYDSVTPVYAFDGGEVGGCRFYLKLTKGEETFYVEFNNLAHIGSGDYLKFDYAYTLTADGYIALADRYPEATSGGTLPIGFYGIYADADSAYALFTGYGRMTYTNDFVEYNGERYQGCADDRFVSLDELKALLLSCFSEEIADKLMNTTVNLGEKSVPLYIEQDGKLYRFSGYSDISPSMINGISFDPAGYRDGEYYVNVNTTAYVTGGIVVLTETFKYIISDDGSVIFTDFTFMDDRAVEENSKPVTLREEINSAYISVFEDETALYCSSTGEKMLLSEYLLGHGYSVQKYTVVDIDGDTLPEAVLWIDKGMYKDYGTLVLNYEDGVVYSFGFAYRQLYGLKADGSFHWSGGISHNGNAKLTFNGADVMMNNILYHEESATSGERRYYVGEEEVDREEYEKAVELEGAKEDAEWIDFDYRAVKFSRWGIDFSVGSMAQISVPSHWEAGVRDDSFIFRQSDTQKGDYGSYISRIWCYRTEKTFEQIKSALEATENSIGGSIITSRTNSGYPISGVYQDNDDHRKYVFHITAEDGFYIIEITRWNVYDSESFENEIAIPIVQSFSLEYSEPVTITDIADWETLPWRTDGPVHSQNAYNFINNLVSGESDIPEYNGLGITDYSITLLEDQTAGFATLRFTFTVTGNSLPETLPPGTYTKLVYDGMDVSLYDEEVPDEFHEYEETDAKEHGLDKFGDEPAVLALHKYFCYMFGIWEVSPYGEWDAENYYLPYNYITAFYGDESMVISFTDAQRLLSEKFGIAVERLDRSGMLSRCEYDSVTDTIRYADTRGNAPIHRFIDVTKQDGVTYVTVQLYADRLYLVPSHKVQYMMGENIEFIGYRVVEFGKYEPREILNDHVHSYLAPAYYTTFRSTYDGKVYHNKYYDCAECGYTHYSGIVLCGYQDSDECKGGCTANQ